MHPLSSQPLPRRSLLLALAGAGLQACAGVPALTGGPARAASQVVGPTVADRGSPHYRFDTFEFDAADGQRHYRMQLAMPMTPPPAAGHPLLLMLDGNAAFGALTDEMLAQMAASGRPVALAALGYQTEQAIDTTARAFDYTPPVPGEHPTWDNEARQRRGGGADIFLDLIAQKVLPDVRRRLPVDAARTTLWGHSYGGLLALYALFTRPGLFARYAAADASLWWHDGAILDVERRAQPLPMGRTTELLLMAGGANAPRQPERPVAAPAAADAPVAASASAPASPPHAAASAARDGRRVAMADAAPQLAARQSQRPGLSVQWLPFPGVGHGPMRPASLPPTLRLAAR